MVSPVFSGTHTGKIVADKSVVSSTTLNGVSYNWPSTDGDSGTVLTTDGIGNLSWASSGTVSSGNTYTTLGSSGTIPYLISASTQTSSQLVRDGGTSFTLVGSSLTVGGNIGGTTINALSSILLGGNNINTSPVLNNIAYLNYNNSFSKGQTISATTEESLTLTGTGYGPAMKLSNTTGNDYHSQIYVNDSGFLRFRYWEGGTPDYTDRLYIASTTTYSTSDLQITNGKYLRLNNTGNGTSYSLVNDGTNVSISTGVTIPTGATYKINNVDINNAGTLSNVAYKNQANVFSTYGNTFDWDTGGQIIISRLNSIPITGNDIGYLDFRGKKDASTFGVGGYITLRALENWTTSSTPGELVFLTTPSGATSGASYPRVRISTRTAILDGAKLEFNNSNNTGNISLRNNSANQLVVSSGTLVVDGGNSGLITTDVNATSSLKLNGININTAGTLTNVPYLNKVNNFTANQGINDSSPDQSLVIKSPSYGVNQRLNARSFLGETSSHQVAIYGWNLYASSAAHNTLVVGPGDPTTYGFHGVLVDYIKGIRFISTVPASGYSIGSTISDDTTDSSLMRMQVDPSGSVKITNLSGTGNRAVYSDSSGVLTNTSSDLRLKKNISEISSSLDVIATLKQLRGVYYNWDTSVEAVKGLGEQKEIGMIAQEVEVAIPEVVGENGNGYKSLDYAKMVAFLIEVAKNQQLRIEALEEEVEGLKNQ